MGLRRKKSLIDQATDYVEGVIPQIESAVASARDKALPLIADARDKAAPVISDARDKAAPVIADARAKAGPMLAGGAAIAADKAAIGASIAADKASIGASIAAEKAAQARDLAAAKVAQVKGEPEPKRGGKLKKLLLFTGLAALGGFVYNKLRGGANADNWQSSYVPSPAPARPAPTHAAPIAESDDPGGSSPDEILSDEADEPREATTPDDPAEVVTLDEDAAKKS
jgi:hypothetical protein